MGRKKKKNKKTAFLFKKTDLNVLCVDDISTLSTVLGTIKCLLCAPPPDRWISKIQMGRDAIVGSDGIIERKKEDGGQKRIRKRIGEREKKNLFLL